MAEKKNTESIANIDRRKFLKCGAVLGAAVGLSSLTGGKTTEEVAKAIGKKELDKFPHEVSPDFEQYDDRRTCFNRNPARGASDPTMVELVGELPGLWNVIDDSKPGTTSLDMAFLRSSWASRNKFGPQVYHWNHKPVGKAYEFSSKEDATKTIKKVAKFFGADLVGITPYDERWMYEPKVNASDFQVVSQNDSPFKPKSVIVMALEQDYETFGIAPSLIGGAAAGVIYSKMLEVSLKVANFINHLGYNAYPAGNDSAESVPYAIAAGLGEQGRMGILITYEYGPRVRICKVFTEMELNYDKPIKFGANKFCQVCKKCAYDCPSQSISLKDEMTWKGETPTISNHEGVLKYYVNVETCFKYWCTVGNGCGVCVAVCPYNKPDFWHHRITTAMTGTPLKPFLNEMDDLFGYGDVFNDQKMIDFWDIENYLK